jgi:hypothetical protein
MIRITTKFYKFSKYRGKTKQIIDKRGKILQSFNGQRAVFIENAELK